jgi:lipoate-protein ligase A
MGADEALLSTAIRDGIASLRFYSWDGPWLSLGYAQAFAAEQLPQLARAGVGVVRRVTGGRAVLHGADLTYSLAAPEGLLPDGVRASYGVVADGLLAALAELGVVADRSDPAARAPDARVFDCFARPAADEICLGGRKLSGSAQRRVAGALLQHGSIRLAPDPLSAVAAVAPNPAGLGGTSLAEEGCPLSRDALEEACIEALERTLGARFERSNLSSEERAQARSRGPEPRLASSLESAAEPSIPPDSWGKPPQERPSSTR